MSGLEFKQEKFQKETYFFMTLRELRPLFLTLIDTLRASEDRRLRIKPGKDRFQWRLILDSNIRARKVGPVCSEASPPHPPLPSLGAGHGAGEGSFGLIIPSKKTTEGVRSIKKVLKFDSYVMPVMRENAFLTLEQLLSCSKMFFQEFYVLTQMYPIFPCFKFSLEIKADLLSADAFFDRQFCYPNLAARFRLPHLGAQNMQQYCNSLLEKSGEADDRSKFLYKFPAVYTITSQVLSQLIQLAHLGSGSKESYAHLDIKPENIVVDSKGLKELPRASLIDYGATLCEEKFSNPAYLESPRTSVLDPRALCFPTSCDHSYKVDSFSLGLSGLMGLGLFAYSAWILQPINKNLERIYRVGGLDTEKTEKIGKLCQAMELKMIKKFKEARAEVISNFTLLNRSHSLFLIHWKAAFEVLLWLAEIKPEDRLGLDNFSEISGYLKVFSESLLSIQDKILDPAFIFPSEDLSAVFSFPIPGILLERLRVKYPLEDFLGVAESLSSGVLSPVIPKAPVAVHGLVKAKSPEVPLCGLGFVLVGEVRKEFPALGSHPFASSSLGLRPGSTGVKHKKPQVPEEEELRAYKKVMA